MRNLSVPIVDGPLRQQSIRARCLHPTGTFFEFKKEEIEGSIPDRFEQQVNNYPQQITIKARSHELTT